MTIPLRSDYFTDKHIVSATSCRILCITCQLQDPTIE